MIINYIFFTMMAAFFLFGGLLLIYQALKKDIVMVIKFGNTSETFPLTIIKKNNQLNIFISSLKQIVGSKLIIEVTDVSHPDAGRIWN